MTTLCLAVSCNGDLHNIYGGMLMKKKRNDKENINYLYGFLGSTVVEGYLRACENFDHANLSEEDMSIYETVKRHLVAMQKYGDNRWWCSEDSNAIGYYQLREPVSLVPYSVFIASLEKMVGHEVDPFELVVNEEYLIEETEKAYGSKRKKRKTLREAIAKIANSTMP